MLQNARNRPKRGSGTDTPESEMDKKACKSPASNVSSPSDKNKKKVRVPSAAWPLWCNSNTVSQIGKSEYEASLASYSSGIDQISLLHRDCFQLSDV
jgi:hypothetical protein